MDTLDAINKRRSMRKYSPQKLTMDELTPLLEAAMAAPSAMNSQPWEFIVITDEKKLEELRMVLPYGKFEAPAAIIVCGNHLKAKNPGSWGFWVQDCSAATENILLAATALGLGSCWIGVHPIGLIKQGIRKVLKLPVGVIPFCAVYLGHPEFEKKGRTQFDESKVHCEHYGASVSKPAV
jgi:nitroreductase